MAKNPAQRATTGSSSRAASLRRYKAAGKLADGVTILAPKSKPKHFTSKQIRSTIEEFRKNRKTGHLLTAGD